MTTTTLPLDRTLPSWDVSDEFNTLMTKVRKRPGVYYRPDERFNARLAELITIEKPNRDRLTLGSFLDANQLDAVLTGEMFSIRRTRLRSCIFSSGRIIHLQNRVAGSSGRYGSSGFSEHTVCSANGSFLYEFDDLEYERLATTRKVERLEVPTGKTLTAEQMLGNVCVRCVAIAHRRALEPR